MGHLDRPDMDEPAFAGGGAQASNGWGVRYDLRPVIPHHVHS